MGMQADVVCLHPHPDIHSSKSQLALVLLTYNAKCKVIIPERNYLVQLAYNYTNL
jgi:hypothetical protein